MNKLLKSTPLAWLAMLMIVIVLVCTYKLRPASWAFIDIFFFFIMAFCHAVACSFAKLNPAASRRLDSIALVCGIIAVVALIVEAVVWSFF